jgi:HEAT repeat protein
LAIRASSSKQIDALINDLGGSAVARETAIARLTLLGARAVERLIAATVSAGDADARAGAWRALEGIGDGRALEPALAALATLDVEPAVGAAAAGVARAHLHGARGAIAVDRLAEVLLDRTRAEVLRLAALRALRELDPSTIAPILASLAGDPNETIRTEAGLSGRAAPIASHDLTAEIARAASGTLRDDPVALRHALKLAGATVPLTALHKVVDRVREREGSEPAAVRDQWRLTRAAAHVTLAHRGSRLALYDLRESLETAKGPLPVEFLAAIALIGDASCVEAIAAAHAKAKDAWWREHLARAFRDIVARERLTRRHAAIARIAKRFPQTLRDMWPGGSGGSGRSGR